MNNSIVIKKVYKDSFRANVYTQDPFRVIGLIDVDIRYKYGTERVTLAYYRSSGTNSGKIKGLWYPIVGIKMHSGGFTEFTDYLNHVLTNTTKWGVANKGWLAKSLFFGKSPNHKEYRGFSNGLHYEKLLRIGKLLRHLYGRNRYDKNDSLNAEYLNKTLAENEVLFNNSHTQRENFERFVQEIYEEIKESRNHS